MESTYEGVFYSEYRKISVRLSMLPVIPLLEMILVLTTFYFENIEGEI